MVLIDWLSKVRSNVTRFPVGTRLKKRKAFRSHHSIESLESRTLLSGVMANPDTVSTEAYQYEPVIIDALANDTSDVGGLSLASVGTTSAGHAEIIHIPAADASIEETDAYNNYVMTYGAPADRDFIVYTPYSDFIGEESFTYVAEDSTGNQATSTATVSFTDPYSNSYEETQQLAEDLLGEEYASVEEEFYDSASQYADETEGNNTDPDYDAALENSPLEDLTDPFDDELTQEEYDALADETLDDATSEDTTDSGTTDTPIDPRLQWTAFAFTDEIAFPTASLPAEAMLDDLFSLTPDGTENFSITTEEYAAPLVEELTHDAGTGTKQTAAHTSTTLSQEWFSPDEWIVTQSITRYFESEENSDLTDGSTDTIGRAGSTTLTISVINGTHTIVTYSISDSFSYNNIYEWDNYADAMNPDGDPVTSESDILAGDPAQDEEEEFTPADNGRFEYGFQNSSSLSVTLEQVLITLPDGRLATQYSLNYSTSSSFSANVSAKQEFREQEGTLAKFVRAVPTTDSDTVGNDGTTDTDAAIVADPGSSGTDGGTDPTANQDVFDYDHGGNGSMIDFNADYGFNTNFSNNFNLNLTTIVPEDELIDDQVVTGSGAYGLSSGTTTSSKGGLSIQVQESGGDPSTDTHNHEYITYSSSTDSTGSGNFSFDIDFDIDSSTTTDTGGETSAGPETTAGTGTTEETETPEGTTTTDGSASLTSGTPQPDFNFNYSTDDGITLSATLMYSHTDRSTGQEPTHHDNGVLQYSPATYDVTDVIYASGDFNASGDFGFTAAGLTVSGQTSGSGDLIITHRSITTVDLPTSFSANSVSVSTVETLSKIVDSVSTVSFGTFDASFSLTIGFDGTITPDGDVSAEYEESTHRVWQIDWHSWETDEDANITYESTGTQIDWETETYTLTASLNSGINATSTLTVDSYGNQVTDGQPSTNQSSPTTTIEPTSTGIIDPVWFDPEVALGAMAGVAQGMTMVANHFTLNSYTGWLDDLTGSDINGAVDQWVEDGGWYYSTANQSARVGAHLLHAVVALESLEMLSVTTVGSTQLWGHHCFTAGTPVSTPSGLRSIETIDIGDEVWAYNLATERWESKRVLDTHRHESSGDFVTVHVAGDAIESTYHHPYWVVSGDSLDKRSLPDHLPALDTNTKTPGRWVDAGDLRVGDLLLLKDGRHAPIEELHFAAKTETVYNFQVADLHNYAVGQLAVLVHNNSGHYARLSEIHRSLTQHSSRLQQFQEARSQWYLRMQEQIEQGNLSDHELWLDHLHFLDDAIAIERQAIDQLVHQELIIRKILLRIMD